MGLRVKSVDSQTVEGIGLPQPFFCGRMSNQEVLNKNIFCYFPQNSP